MADSRRSSALTLFYCYDYKDQGLRDELHKHLMALRRSYLLTVLEIEPGMDSGQVIAEKLERVDVILLLVSSDLLKHSYCYSAEMQHAVARHQSEAACVVPILLRPAIMTGTPFEHLDKLPSDGHAVTLWGDEDEAFVDIALDLNVIISAFLDRRTAGPHNSQGFPIPPSGPRPVRPADRRQQAGARNTSTNGTIYIQTESREERRQRKYREIMLERVEQKWIKGVLEKTFAKKARIDLGLRERPHLVADPWSDTMQEQDTHTGPLSFDSLDERISNGSSLILGPAGGGKTTLMLDILKRHLERARNDDLYPLPIVFNLSSWVRRRLPLDEWLIEELKTKYNLDRQQAAFWVKERAILPLLDGLDEVPKSARAASLNAINLYHHSLTPLIVCSRQSEYEQLIVLTQKKLKLDIAVVIQNLTLPQVDLYLTNCDPPLDELNEAIHNNPTLQELADTPLMLNVLAEVSKSTPLKQIQVMEVGQIFELYIQNMLKRRGGLLYYTAEQIRHWLAYLAGQMLRREQTEFYQEQLQKDWLPVAAENVYRLILGVVFGLLVGIVMILVYAATFFLNPEVDKLQIVIFGIAYTAVFIFLYGVLFNFLASSPRTLPGNALGKIGFALKERVNQLLQQPIVYGLLIGLIHFFLIKNFVLLSAAAIHSMFIAAGYAVIGRIDTTIRPAEEISWSWDYVRSNFWKCIGGGLLCGLGMILIAGPLTALVIDSLQNQKSPPIPLTPMLFFYFILVGLACGVVFGFIFIWISGISYTMREKNERQIPNQGIYRSARNSMILGLSSGILVGSLTALLFGPGASWLKEILPNQYNNLYKLSEAEGIFWGIGVGIAAFALISLRNGGVVCIQHYLLRFLLMRSGAMPWRYTRMLDEATNHNLLYNVGGGYRFIHDLFLKHFASLASTSLLTDEPRDVKTNPLGSRETAKPQFVKTEWFLAPAILVTLLLIVIVAGSNLKSYFDTQNTARMEATVLATASLTHPYPSYFPPANASLISFDSLTQEELQWNTSHAQHYACHFLQSGYEIRNANQANTIFCLKNQPLRNFAMSVTMVIKQGDCGGIVFRATFQPNIKNYYFFDICTNGTYGFGENFDGDKYNLPVRLPLTLQADNAIKIHYQEKNTLAMVANKDVFSFYLNGQEIFHTQNADIAQGDFGFNSGNIYMSKTTDVVYTDLLMWSLN